MLGNKGTKKNYRTGGTRGGQASFNWDDVKSDKDRENYLGHSAMAPVGRWQKGRDLLWYSKVGQGDSEREGVNQQLQDEKRRMKEIDEDMIDAALGIKSTRKRQYEDTLDAEEMKVLMARGQLDRDEGEASERIKGLGAAPAKLHDHIERVSYLERQIEQLKKGQQIDSGAALTRMEGTGAGESEEGGAGTVGNGHEGGAQESDSESSKKHKKHKKAKKEHKHKHKHRDREGDREGEKKSHKHKKSHRDRDGDRDGEKVV